MVNQLLHPLPSDTVPVFQYRDTAGYKEQTFIAPTQNRSKTAGKPVLENN